MSEARKAAIFDLDGTMLDNHDYHQKACILLCEKYGRILTAKEFSERYVGYTTREFVQDMFGAVTDSVVRRYENEKEALYRHLYREDITPIEGLVELLKAMKSDGYLLGVATSAPIENLDFSLRSLSLEDYFDSLFCIGDVKESKPHPEIYLKSMENLGVAAKRTIIFEDSGPGVIAAVASNAHVIGIRTSMKKEQFGNIAMTVRDYTELSVPILNRIVA